MNEELPEQIMINGKPFTFKDKKSEEGYRESR